MADHGFKELLFSFACRISFRTMIYGKSLVRWNLVEQGYAAPASAEATAGYMDEKFEPRKFTEAQSPRRG
jgi:hypothetical protein